MKEKPITIMILQDGFEGYEYWCSNCKKKLGKHYLPFIRCPTCKEKTVGIYQEGRIVE